MYLYKFVTVHCFETEAYNLGYMLLFETDAIVVFLIVSLRGIASATKRYYFETYQPLTSSSTKRPSSLTGSRHFVPPRKANRF